MTIGPVAADTEMKKKLGRKCFFLRADCCRANPVFPEIFFNVFSWRLKEVCVCVFLESIGLGLHFGILNDTVQLKNTGPIYIQKVGTVLGRRAY